VLTIPRVATVDVRRELPGTVTVSVTEREPVLAVPGAPAAGAPAGALALVDASGFAYRTVPTRPAGVPLLHLPPGVVPRPDDPATRAAVAVVTALPATLRRGLTDVTATSAFDVALALTGGRQVRWSADADNPRKAAVLGPLLTRPGTVYDVSTPELAVVS
jgi:cell division protein FtsQ